MAKLEGLEPANVDQVTIEQAIACVDRELAMRRRVYPRWSQENKITFFKAQKELKEMTAVKRFLEKVQSQFTNQTEMKL